MEKIREIFEFFIMVAWPVVMISLAAASFYRFRATVSGFLLGVPFAIMAFLNIFFTVAYRTFFKEFLREDTIRFTINIISNGVYFLIYLTVAVGIFLILRSLKKLHKSAF